MPETRAWFCSSLAVARNPVAVFLAGDLANKDGVRRTLRRLESIDNLVHDLTQVTFIDSTFISELLLLEKARHANSLSQMTIVVPAKSVVRRVFEVVGLTAVLAIVESYNDGRGPNSVIEFAPHGDELDPTAGVIS